MNNVYLKDGLELDECFAVDLDISLPGIPSIGHHFLLFYNDNNWNPNTKYGISDPKQFQSLNDYMRAPRFKQKCPLPTILLLHHLTRVPLPQSPLARAVYLYADGLHYSYNCYKNNVKTWLKEFHFDSLIQDLESSTLESHMLTIRSLVQNQAIRMSGRGFKVTKRTTNPQANFKPLEIDLLLPFLQTLQDLLFQNKTSISIPDVSTFLEGYYCQFHMNDIVYKKLQEMYKKGQMISHGLVYSNVVSTTLTTPLNEQSDMELLRARTPRCVK